MSMEHVHWYWLAAGVVLIALEAFAPGAVLLWFGVAALATGLLTLVTDINVDQQVLFFSVVAVMTTAVMRYWQRRQPDDSEPVEGGGRLNHPGERHIGRTLTLITDLQGGSGRVKLADASWRCTGPDLPAGTRVTVIGVESGTLVVKPADDNGNPN